MTRIFTCHCLATSADAASLTSLKINEFVLIQASRLSLGSLNNMLNAVRRFLQFLFLRGYVGTSLAGAVPHTAHWLPVKPSRAMSQEQVRRLLESCDRDTHAGVRNFAILMLIFRLGLRSQEVATLILEHIDWASGELLIIEKGNRHDRLPLPVGVGEAMADYCYR